MISVFYLVRCYYHIVQVLTYVELALHIFLWRFFTHNAMVSLCFLDIECYNIDIHKKKYKKTVVCWHCTFFCMVGR